MAHCLYRGRPLTRNPKLLAKTPMPKKTTIATATLLTIALAVTPAAAQEKPKKAAAKAEVVKGLAEMSVNRELFSGSESRIAAMNSVNTDCTSGPIPSLRIVIAPKNGTHRLEEITV